MAARGYFIPGGTSQRRVWSDSGVLCRTLSAWSQMDPAGSRQDASRSHGTRRGPYVNRTRIVMGPSSHPSGLVGSRRAISAEIVIPSGFRHNPNLARQAPSGPDGSRDCVVSVYDQDPKPPGPLRQPHGLLRVSARTRWSPGGRVKAPSDPVQ